MQDMIIADMLPFIAFGGLGVAQTAVFWVQNQNLAQHIVIHVCMTGLPLLYCLLWHLEASLSPAGSYDSFPAWQQLPLQQAWFTL